jgi:GNAT superfamily N-acetyltransferase
MEVRVHEDLREFWDIAGPRYLADPVRHTLALTVVRRVMEASHPSDLPPVLLTLWEDGRLFGSTFRTPPWPVGVSGLPTSAIEPATARLLDVDPELPGVAGPRDIAEPFAEVWAQLTGTAVKEAMAGRLYRLGTLEAPTVGGVPRLVGSDEDILRVAGWREDFQIEASGHVRVPGVAESDVRRSLALGNAHIIWDVDGRPVAYAAVGKPINGMSRVGPVYTLPGERGHGYGSAVTAAASRWALDAGAEYVLLFTDLANPTSNSIYQRIGYRPVMDTRRAGIPQVISEPWPPDCW